MAVEKISTVTKCWENVGYMYDDRNSFFVCSFIGDVYVIGGDKRGRRNSCI